MVVFVLHLIIAAINKQKQKNIEDCIIELIDWFIDFFHIIVLRILGLTVIKIML